MSQVKCIPCHSCKKDHKPKDMVLFCNRPFCNSCYERFEKDLKVLGEAARKTMEQNVMDAFCKEFSK